MNCKPGDLAVIVLTGTEYDGTFVDVLELVDGYWDCLTLRERLDLSIDDGALRPIRDQPGDDETLTWAGKPQEVKA